MNNSKIKAYRNLILLVIVFSILPVLKLSGVITWSWWAATSPIWIFAFAVIVMLAIAGWFINWIINMF